MPGLREESAEDRGPDNGDHRSNPEHGIDCGAPAAVFLEIVGMRTLHGHLSVRQHEIESCTAR